MLFEVEVQPTDKNSTTEVLDGKARQISKRTPSAAKKVSSRRILKPKTEQKAERSGEAPCKALIIKGF